MEYFFNWLSQTPLATNVLAVAFLIIVITIVLMYVIAFLQGRSVSFWPPEIGSNNPSKSSGSETILYDSREGKLSDFDTEKTGVWKSPQQSNVGEKAQGELEFTVDQILNVERTNSDGRFKIWLEEYLYAGASQTFLPKNPLISGKRKIRVSCEVKVTQGKHTLEFAFFTYNGGKREKYLAKHSEVISENEWRRFNIVLRFNPGTNCQFRIVDCEVSTPPSSLQIRHLVLAEENE